MTDSHRTHRWRGVVAVSLAAGAVGLLAERPPVLLLAVVGVVFAAYPRLSSAPEPVLELDRRVSDHAPSPGSDVEVTVTVRNAGESVLPDLRVVDGVPAALSVTDGSPRHGTALAVGATDTFRYTVEAEEGTHGFDPATVVARDASGEHEVETTVGVDTTLVVETPASTPRERAASGVEAGRVLTDDAGSGVEFHRTREYQPGDPARRVNWKRYARTGDLTVIDFREERAATVVLAVDAREPAYRGREGEPHAVVHSTATARRLLDGLLSRNNTVGLASLGGDCWLPPSAGRDHEASAHALLRNHAAFSASPSGDEAPDVDELVRRLRERLPEGAQVVLLSPLCDDVPVSAARRLEAHGHPVTVVSPDVTRSTTVGERLAGVERENRITELRRASVSVVDWTTTDPLGLALARARERRAP